MVRVRLVSVIWCVLLLVFGVRLLVVCCLWFSVCLMILSFVVRSC